MGSPQGGLATLATPGVPRILVACHPVSTASGSNQPEPGPGSRHRAAAPPRPAPPNPAPVTCPAPRGLHPQAHTLQPAPGDPARPPTARTPTRTAHGPRLARVTCLLLAAISASHFVTNWGDGQGAERTPEGRGGISQNVPAISGGRNPQPCMCAHVGWQAVGRRGPRHPQDALLLGGGHPQVAGGAPHPCREAPATGFTPRGGGVWDGQLGTSQPRRQHGLQAAGQRDLRAGPRTQGGRGVGGSPPEPPPGSQGPRHRDGGA